jgi:hypothetical protein
MAGPGDSSVEGYGSYLAVGRETTYGTQVTSTAFLEFKSCSVKVIKERRIIEEITTSRTYSKEVGLSKTVEGEIECLAYPESTAFNHLLQNAMGGAITSATGTSETVGGLSFEHTILIGSMNGSYSSISINERKGQATSGRVFEYFGIRVNEMNFTAEIDEPLMCSFAVIGKDCTQTANDISAAYSSTSNEPLSFVSGRISIQAGLLASITTATVWHVQTAEFGISNNLKADAESRRIGSDTLDVLPPGIANLSLSVTMRFNTTTAFAAMMAGTEFSAELEFQGSTLSGSALTKFLKFQYPRLTIADAGDPEISGPDEILTSQVTFNVLRDVSSASGYAMRAIVRNKTASYS